MSQIWPISLDIGNSMVKAVRGNSTPVVFPNLIASDNNNDGLRNFAGFSSGDPLIVEMDELSWAVGFAAEELSRFQVHRLATLAMTTTTSTYSSLVRWVKCTPPRAARYH